MKIIHTKIKKDCRFFDGSRPCKMNKEKGYECANCKFYGKYKERILIIKLDALGDVLRSTCILPKIKEKFPHSLITWLTKKESIDLLSATHYIDRVINYNDAGSLVMLEVQSWDYVYSLDNSFQAASLAAVSNSKIKKGFVLSKKGIIKPTNEASLKWLLMASFDQIKKENKKSYQEIMYEICGFKPPIHKPILELSKDIVSWSNKLIADKPIIIGINTGSGSRWPKKMLHADSIIKVIASLLKENPNYFIILLGGPQEIEKNNIIAAKFKSKKVFNIGCNYSLLQFSAIIKKCNVVLTGDTLALHIATALNIPIVALFGPTSANEIYDYNGLILKLKVRLDCLCCYGDCNKIKNCMSLSINKIVKCIIYKIKQ